MIEERVLGLDISSKTGYSLFRSSPDLIVLEEFGKLEQIKQPDEPYPGSYITWAYTVYEKISGLIDRLHPTVLVIEETSKGSKNAMSQKFLEWIHFLVAKFIKETNIKAVYLMTGEWRNIVGCKMTKEESKRNKDVRKYKSKNSTSLAYDEKGKRVGIITKKHVNVRKTNEIFGLELKVGENDIADAVLLGYAYHLRKYGNGEIRL